MAEGYHVCKTAWIAAYGVGIKMFTNTYQSFTAGFVFLETAESNANLTHKSIIAKSWMKMTFNRIGDAMPDSLTIHLPSYLDHRILYGYMKADLERQGERCISYSHFCGLMNSHFHDVRIPKVCFSD